MDRVGIRDLSEASLPDAIRRMEEMVPGVKNGALASRISLSPVIRAGLHAETVRQANAMLSSLREGDIGLVVDVPCNLRLLEAARSPRSPFDPGATPESALEALQAWLSKAGGDVLADRQLGTLSWHDLTMDEADAIVSGPWSWIRNPGSAADDDLDRPVAVVYALLGLPDGRAEMSPISAAVGDWDQPF